MSTKKLSESAQTFLKVGERLVDTAQIPAGREGPTLVFLHEGLGSVGLWRDFPARVAAASGLGAVVYSRYGNGFSQPLTEARTAGYMHEEALVALPALFEALRIERAILVGHSDGASIALIAAGAGKLPIEAVVVEAPHVFVEPISVASIADIGEQYRAGELRERMRAHHTDVDRTFFGWHDIWLDPSFRDWNIEASVSASRVPILVVQGVDDEYGSLAQVDAIGSLAKGRVDRVILARSGHSPHRDRPQVVTRLVADWIAENAAP